MSMSNILFENHVFVLMLMVIENELNKEKFLRRSISSFSFKEVAT